MKQKLVISASRADVPGGEPVRLFGAVVLALVLVLALMVPAARTGAKSLTDSIRDATETLLEEKTEAGIEDDVSEGIEDDIQDAVEEELEDGLDAAIDEAIQDAIEEEIEDGVVEVIANDIEESIEEVIESDIQDAIAADIESEVEMGVDEDIQEAVAENVEDGIEESVESEVQESVAAGVEEGLEQDIESELQESVAARLEESVEVGVEDAILETVVDAAERRVEVAVEGSERLISKHEWLVMAEPESLEALADHGYVFDRVTRLDALGLQLAEVQAPASFDIHEVRAGVLDVVGRDFAEVDVNQLYTAGIAAPSISEGYDPRAVMAFPEDTSRLPLKIGMIDTSVDLTHPALSEADIEIRQFASARSVPEFHGTAIASIMCADSAEYAGIAPQTHLFAASVFERDRESGAVATTASLVKALNWLTKVNVDVINISLAGPPNSLLEAVLKRVSQQGVVVLAAAGNAGPASKPLYPAAYDSVVAVTAVEPDGRVFRLANRGEHLALSAPGVDVRHAQPGGGYVVSSGTSFAVPFASVAVARLRLQEPESDAVESLYRSALDLGPPGKDAIYGYGLIAPPAQ